MALKFKGGLILDDKEMDFIDAMIEASWDDNAKTSHRDVVTALETLIDTAEEAEDE